MPGDDRVYDLEMPQGRRSGFLSASAACATRSGSAQAEMIRSIEEALGVEPLANNGVMMNWDHVRALCRSGHTVGSHTLTHPNLAQIPESEVDHELRESRRILVSQIGKEVVHLSYPNAILEPHWTPKTCEIAARAGYRTAVTSESGSVSAKDRPLSLRRVPARTMSMNSSGPWIAASSAAGFDPTSYGPRRISESKANDIGLGFSSPESPKIIAREEDRWIRIRIEPNETGRLWWWRARPKLASC